MSAVTKLTLRQELFNAIRRLDLLQELIDDKTVTEIMVNGADAIFMKEMAESTPGTGILNPEKIGRRDPADCFTLQSTGQ